MKTFLLLSLLLLAACTSTNGSMHAAPVNYQASDLLIDGQFVNIYGRTSVKVKKGIVSDKHPGPVEILFDGQRLIYGVLDDNLHGAFTGWNYRGRTTSAECNGNEKSLDLGLQCVVSIDNVPRVSLVFQVY